MFWKQTGKCIFFIFITHQLVTLSTCLRSAGIRTLATAGDFKASGHLSGGDHNYTERDGKLSPRFGRLVLGRAALNYRDGVGLDATGKHGLLNKKFSGYSEYEELIENSKQTGSDSTNASRQSYQQISQPQDPSRTLRNSAAKTESPGNAAQGRTTNQSDNVSAKGWSSHSNGCTLGEMYSRSTDDLKSSGSINYQAGYQSDSALPGIEEGRLSLREVTGFLPGPGSPVTEGWLRTMALVQCGHNNMSLTVRKSESTHLMIDQGQTHPLSLSQLPLCGYSVETTWRDLVFTALYDGCHVRREDGRHVLSLIWRGTPVKMSCPVPPAPAPLSLCCNPFGFTVTVEVGHPAVDVEVDMGQEWRSLASVANLCGYIVEVNSGKLVIAVPFKTCGVTLKDGKYTLSLRTGDKESTFSCPSQFSPPPLPSAYSHPTPSLLTPPPAPTPSPPTGPPAIREHPAQSPTFSWHQPHHPGATPPGQNARDPPPVDSPHFHHRLPILYPQRPPPPLAHPLGPSPPHLLAYSLNPTHASRAPQIPIDAPYAIPALPPHQPPNGAGTLVPDDCASRDSPLRPAVGLPAPAAPQDPLPVPSYYDLMSQLRPHNSQSPHSPFSAHMPPVTQTHHSPPHHPPLPHSHSHSHLNQQQLPPSKDSSHQPHGPIKSPPYSTNHHVNPSYNQAKHPDPAHHHGNPFINQAKALHPVHHLGNSFNQAMPNPAHHHGNPSFNLATALQPSHHHGNPSFNQARPPYPVHHHGNPSFNLATPPHPHGNPSFNLATPPHPVPPCPAASRLKTSVSPVPLTPLPPGSPFFPLPFLSCEPNKMAVTLPSAHPASIAVKDWAVGDWIPIGSADPQCSYMLYFGEQGVLTLSSPLPACYSCSLSPSIISLHVRYWDMALEQLQILGLKCLYSPGSSMQSPAIEHPQVYCTPDHMSVRLPPGVWDVFVQDRKGNEIRLLDAPGDCGYGVRKHDGDGTVLTLPFTCHIAHEGQKRTIGVKILRERGSQVERLSCPVAATIPKEGCGFRGDAQPSCGPGCAPVGRGPRPDPQPGPCFPPTRGYMADEGVAQSEKSPSFQPAGPMGVQLRIGTDQNYTSYYHKSRKFRSLLGRPLFLELRLVNAPDSSLVLLVHYCQAYSTSTQTPRLLIYHRCPYPQQPPLPVPPSPVRRFTLTTFQHLPPGVQFSPDQEISFWCSTEVCSQSEGRCTESCFT
ncbi:hypothetical protein COCON_G00209260 [Conger conger]|uniref:ZP domain-containing protein n=1 Tax=Conger conger TaxID=82655 RepID=A0A9Q1D079_CONCO|nr:hypothetical protein COCON_G00209260 [Conger conger]